SFSNIAASERSAPLPAPGSRQQSPPSLRTAIKDRAVILVAVDKLNRAVGPNLEDYVAHQRAARELALNMGVDAHALAFGVKEGTHRDVGVDLLPGNLHLELACVGSVAFARNVLRVFSGQGKIVLGGSRADGHEKDHGNTAGEATNDPHGTLPNAPALTPRPEAAFQRHPRGIYSISAGRPIRTPDGTSRIPGSLIERG